MKHTMVVLLSLGLFLGLAATAEAGKSSSAGSRSSSSNGGRSYSSGTRSYSSGSNSYSARPSSGAAKVTPAPVSKPAATVGGSSKPAPAAPGARSYSSGGRSTYTSSNSPKAIGTPFDTDAATAQKRAESRAAYQKATAPRSTYTDPKGTTHPIDQKDRQIDNLRSQLDQQRWVNRDLRQQQFYASYLWRPVVVYHDPYNSFFWWWLLDRSLEDRVYWAYHHRYAMDDGRYQALLAHDRNLEGRVRELEAQQIARDPTWAPRGVEPDLMYTNEYVDAVYNPHPSGVTAGKVFFWIFLALLVIGLIWLGVWLVFYKRWGA
jgi:hypothetical protein